MSADFNPELNGYSNQGAFRFWCQKVLPTSYDDSLSYYELLNKVVVLLNKAIDDVTTAEGNITALQTAYVQLQDYVNGYFDNLDVQAEIDHKLDEMAADGSLASAFGETIASEVSDWLTEHITPTTPAVDDTLTVSGAAADAKTVGEKALLASNVTIAASNAASYPNADTLSPNRVYNISNDITSSHVSNLPVYGETGRLIYYLTDSNIGTGIQVYYTATAFWYRIKTSNLFYPWRLADNSDKTVMSSNIVYSSSSTDIPATLGGLTANRIYCFHSSVTSSIANYLPTEAYGVTGHLITFASTNPELSTYAGFLMYMCQRGVWFSLKTSSNFYGWYKTPYLDATSSTEGYAGDAKILGDVLNYGIFSSNIYITHDNAALYEDANTVEPNRVYTITSNVTQSDFLHLPEYGVSGQLVYALSAKTPNVLGFQLYITQLNVWCRVKAATAFRDWYNVGNAYRGYQTQRDFINTYVDKTSIKFGAGSNVFVFGDSITTHNVNFGNTSWIEIIANFVNDTLSQDDTQFVGTTYGVSGTGFMARQDSPTTITDQINGVSSSDWESCTLAIIAAGTNDYNAYGTWSSYKTAIQGAITAIRNKNATVPILFITPIHCRNFIRDNTCADIAACIADVARTNLCSVINGFDIPIPPFSTDTYSDMTREVRDPEDPSIILGTDGLHPNATGIIIYAKCVINAVM